MNAAIASALRILTKRQPQKRLSAKRSSVTPVLVISRRTEDYQQVRDSLDRDRWLVVGACDWRGVGSLSQSVLFPVIVCDRDFEWPDNRGALQNLSSSWRTSSVILLADRWDPDFWATVQQEGGFDVLVRPLNGDDVLAVLDTAYRQWADGRSSQAVITESSANALSRSHTAP